MVSLAVPVLKEIVKQEKDRDLVNRAEIALLRVDPKSLAPITAAKPSGKKPIPAAVSGQPRMLHLQIFQNGAAKPLVDLNVPVSFAQMAVSALDEPAKAEMRKKGFDVENVMRDLERMGPAKILTIRDANRTVQLWIE